jgi:ABC-type lipoprotein export system ATPase subunit
VRALDSVSFTLNAGSFAAVVGESGSGKTTLLTLLGALDVPTSGSISVAGRLLTGKTRREMAALRARSIGFIFQGFDLIESLTALENVALPVHYAGRPYRAAIARARELLRDVELADRADHLPGELSGGQQQRVAVARALANEPQVVLADEPTGELDSKTAAQVVALLRRLNRERGVTIVVVTHNLALFERCYPILQLQDGRLQTA